MVALVLYRRSLVRTLFGLALCLSGVTARAELLVNGSFEDQPNFVPSDAGYLAFTDAEMPGWTIASGHFVTVHRQGSGNPTIAGNYTVNTDGEGTNGNNAVMYQDFATTLGVSYQLTFTWQDWWDDDEGSGAELNVSLTDVAASLTLFDSLYTSDGSFSPHYELVDFIGTGNVLRLLVQQTPQSGENDNLYLVDDFSVTTKAVPEPASLVLLGTSVLGALGYARRRSRS